MESRACGANKVIYSFGFPTPMAHLMTKSLPRLYLTISILVILEDQDCL